VTALECRPVAMLCAHTRDFRTRSLAGALLGLGLCLLGAGCGEDDRPAVWSYISPVIIRPNCATVSCHSRAAAVAGLDFSDPDRGYTSLMGLKVWIVDSSGETAGCKNIDGQTVCQRDFRPMVTPYNPQQSRLVNMLRARGARLMPPDRPLPEADIQLIERWIRNGAPRRGPGGPDAGAAARDGQPPPTPSDAATDRTSQ